MLSPPEGALVRYFFPEFANAAHLGRQVLRKSISFSSWFVFPAARFKPGTAGCEARTLPLCYAIPPCTMLLSPIPLYARNMSQESIFHKWSLEYSPTQAPYWSLTGTEVFHYCLDVARETLDKAVACYASGLGSYRSSIQKHSSSVAACYNNLTSG